MPLPTPHRLNAWATNSARGFEPAAGSGATARKRLILRWRPRSSTVWKPPGKI